MKSENSKHQESSVWSENEELLLNVPLEYSVFSWVNPVLSAVSRRSGGFRSSIAHIRLNPTHTQNQVRNYSKQSNDLISSCDKQSPGTFITHTKHTLNTH